MTVSTDQNFKKVVDLEALKKALNKLDPEERVVVSKLIASHMIEYAAFEMAPFKTAAEVSELIFMAMKLLDREHHQTRRCARNPHRDCAEN